MNEFDINAFVTWLLGQLEPKVNVFAVLGITVLSQLLKRPLPLKEDSVLFIPLVLSVVMTVLHVAFDDVLGIKIAITVLTYLALSVGAYLLLRKLGIFKSKYEMDGGLDRRKKRK
jgi:hypothetical protein